MHIREKNVVLRDMVCEDIERYVRWWTDETEWQLWDAPWEYEDAPAQTEDELHERFRRFYERTLPEVRRSLEIEVDGIHVGWVNAYLIGDDPDKLALGICIPDPEVRGKGVGTTAFGLFLRYQLFHNRDSVYSQTWSGNLPMRRLLQKHGFTETERRTGVRRVRGKSYDALTFILTRETVCQTVNPFREASEAYQDRLSVCYGCPVEFFTDGGVHVVERPNTPVPHDIGCDHKLRAATFGMGAVVSVAPELYHDCSSLAEVPAAQLLQSEGIVRMNAILARHGDKLDNLTTLLLYTSRHNDLSAPEGYTFRLDERIELPEALRQQAAVLDATDVLTLYCQEQGNTAAMVACKDHADGFWQIGLDILPWHQRKGLSSYLVNRLAEEICARGKFACCSRSVTDLPAMQTAGRAGFLPVCLDVASCK